MSPLPPGLRVAIVLGSLRLAGAERQALLLARHLQHAHDARVTVCGPPPEDAAAAWCRQQGIPLLRLPLFESRRPWLCRLRMRRAAFHLRTLTPAVVAAFTWTANVAVARYRGTIGASTVLWGQRDAGINRLVPALESAALARVDLAVANSPPALDALRAAGVAEAKLALVPNAVELPPPVADRAAWRHRLGITDEAVAGVMLAHLHANKDHATLLRAWAVLARGAPAADPVLILAGRDDGGLAALRALAQELGIAGLVRFPGAVDDIGGLLAASDLGVFSSRSEGCPNGVLEAMAAGLAVAATDLPGIRWALGAETPLAPPGDAVALAALAGRLIGDPTLRAALGTRNRAAIAERFAPLPALEAYVAAIARASDR